MPNFKKAARPKTRAVKKSAAEQGALSSKPAKQRSPRLVNVKAKATARAAAKDASTNEESSKLRRRKKTTMAAALRCSGLDEYEVAENYAGIVNKLSVKNSAGSTKGAVSKQLIDVLKECTRHLEPPPRAGITTGSTDVTAPVQVQLVHHVERPGRELPLADDTSEKETP